MSGAGKLDQIREPVYTSLSFIFLGGSEYLLFLQDPPLLPEYSMMHL
jgi:hypothetical protein